MWPTTEEHSLWLAGTGDNARRARVAMARNYPCPRCFTPFSLSHAYPQWLVVLILPTVAGGSRLARGDRRRSSARRGQFFFFLFLPYLFHENPHVLFFQSLLSPRSLCCRLSPSLPLSFPPVRIELVMVAAARFGVFSSIRLL